MDCSFSGRKQHSAGGFMIAPLQYRGGYVTSADFFSFSWTSTESTSPHGKVAVLQAPQ